MKMRNKRRRLVCSLLVALAAVSSVGRAVAAVVKIAPQVFDAGGWKCDVQFMDVMGSPYLLAHGFGVPVADATARVRVPEGGNWRVYVRARNWADGAPGAFQVKVNGRALAKTFGVSQSEWAWEDGGEVALEAGMTRIALHDLTGFEGRCAGIAFVKGEAAPTGAISPRDVAVTETVETEFCVVGGGLPGCAAAVTAARSGVRTVLLQDRPVLGGNASQEIRVWCAGEGRSFPIIEALRGDFYNGENGAEVADSRRRNFVEAEANVDLRLRHRVFAARKDEKGAIVSALALDWARNEVVEVRAKWFLDATGDGWLGFYAGAEYRMGRERKDEFDEPLYGAEKADGDTLGSSLCWYSQLGVNDNRFSAPWAEKHACGIEALKGDWNWEYGIHRDMIQEAEHIRDRLFLAIFGSFSLAKKRPENSRSVLVSVPFVLGKRESRRLVGDYLFNENDVVRRTPHADAIAKCSWPIDLHFDDKLPGVDFITRCTSGSRGRSFVPFRSIYSKNVPNLMMAGRCFSCTHVGLGSPRVMNTLAQMGLAAGYAAFIMKRDGIAGPREVYRAGKVREIQRLMGGDWPDNPDPARAGWRILDDEDAGMVFGAGWRVFGNPNGEQVGQSCHVTDAAKKEAVPVTYPLGIAKAGRYALYQKIPYWPWPREDGVGEAAYDLVCRGEKRRIMSNQYLGMGEWRKLGEFDFAPGDTLTIVPKESTAKGLVFADGFAIAPMQ